MKGVRQPQPRFEPSNKQGRHTDIIALGFHWRGATRDPFVECGNGLPPAIGIAITHSNITRNGGRHLTNCEITHQNTVRCGEDLFSD